MRVQFIEGCITNGISESSAHELFDMLEYFGRYGFNKAHAAAYAVITCQTAYLKAKFPVEYMAAFLSVEKGNSDRVAAGVAECRRLGIEIKPPDVNHSGWDFTVAGAAVRFGLGAIKNVGEGAVEAILVARRDGPFEDLDEFVRRADLRQVNRRALECLIRAGALDRFGHRAQLQESAGAMLAASTRHHQASEAGQMSLFEGESGVDGGGMMPLGPTPEIPRKDQLAWEKELMGVYVSEHPLQRVEAELEKAVTILCGQIDRTVEGETITTAGVVTSVRRITTRKGDPMAFARLEDLQGAVEVVVFPRVYERSSSLWHSDNILIITGRVEVDDEGLIKIIANSAADYRDWKPKATDGGTAPSIVPRHLHITFTASPDEVQDIARLGEIHQLLTLHPGEDRFSLYIEREDGLVQLSFPNDTTSFSPELAATLDTIVPNGRIRVEEVPVA
ncbi:MAG: OB-fold nucleic acid binding domain-containing protein [Anaerolineae bacterium]